MAETTLAERLRWHAAPLMCDSAIRADLEDAAAELERLAVWQARAEGLLDTGREIVLKLQAEQQRIAIKAEAMHAVLAVVSARADLSDRELIEALELAESRIRLARASRGPDTAGETTP